MGNTLLDKPSKRKDDPVQQFDLWLDQNTDLLTKKLHSQNKLFKSVSYIYKSKAQSLLFKAYFNYEKINLEEFHQNFELIRKVMDPNYYHNMLPYVQFKNFQHQASGFVVALRQYISTTLEQRLVNQPLLSQDEKIWIIFQMIVCVYGLHVEGNLYHGNIRTSNFLLQNNNHLVLADIASYKPLYLFENDLAEARIFYGSSTDKCTLAPEKVIKQSGKEQVNRSPTELLRNYKKDKAGFNKLASMGEYKQFNINSSSSDDITMLPVSQQLSLDHKISSASDSPNDYNNLVKNQKMMDIFSLGVSILQVFLNGKALMTFSDLLRFRKDEYSLQNYIDSAVEGLPQGGQKIKVMLNMMLQKDPEKRPSIQFVLSIWHQTIKRDSHVLNWYLQALFSKSSFILPDLRIGLIRKIVEKIEQNQPFQNRYKMKMDLSTDIQKLDLLRIMMSLIDRNIMPNLERIGLAKKSIIYDIQKSLQQQSQIVREEEPEIIKQSPSRSRGMSLFEMKPKESISKQIGNQFTSMDNLKKKDFNQKAQRVVEEENLQLCPPKWCPILENLIKTKFNGVKLTENQQAHNRFQDLLHQIRQSQYKRQRYSQLTHYHQYEEIIKLLFSNIRTTSSVSNRLSAVELLYTIGRASAARVKLTKIIPLILNLMGDSEQRVATFSLRCLINLFYTFMDIFNSLEDTKYYRTIIQGFNTASKSSVLRLVLFQKLPQILKILQWLALNQLKYVKNFQIQSDQNSLIQSILKQYGSLSSNQKQVLLSNASKIWIPSFIPFFGSMMNIQKVLCFKQSLQIATELDKSRTNQLEFLDMCLDSGLDQSGLAVFYSIRYFRIRKIIKQQSIIKIVPLILYPNRWIHEEVVLYIKMCLQNYPATKLYFIFNRCLQLPFPIEPSQFLNLPSMIPSKAFKEKKFNEKNKTVALFVKYLAKCKAAKQYPQNTQQIIKKWNQASKDLIINELIVQDRRISNSLGLQIAQYISSLNIKNLLYFISLMKKPYSQQIQNSTIQLNSTIELIELCQRSYNFNIGSTSSANNYQKHLLMHIQSYLTTNSESFLKAQGLNSFYFKKLFAQNLIKTNSIVNQMDNFQIIPTLQLGKYVRQPTEQSKLNRPMGILIGQVHQHKDIISCIEKVADRFFLTGSYDGTLRLFDSKRLQQDITSDSIGLINFHQELNDTSGSVKVTSACVFEDTHSVAVATTKGTVGLYRIESMSKGGSPLKPNKSKKINSNLQLIKTFNAVGEIEKVITLKNQLKHSTFGVVTSEGWLALQDIRIKKQAYKCNLGKERGMPKSFISLPGTNTLAIGTMNGYILLYDIRCNLVSNIYEFNYDNQNPPVLYLQSVPQSFHTEQNQQLLAVGYPSKNYQFCHFNMNCSNKQKIDLEEMFTSSNQQDCIVPPFLSNKTKNQSFKICNNNLRQKSYYNSFIPDFYSKLDILDYLKDPLTINESQVKEKWLSQSKQKYAQITSISNKRHLPFIQYLQGKILTNMNPIIASKGQTNQRNKNKTGDNLALLNTVVNKKQGNVFNPIEKSLKKVGKYVFMPEDEATDYYTCCKIMPNFVVTGSRDSLIKIYK